VQIDPAGWRRLHRPVRRAHEPPGEGPRFSGDRQQGALERGAGAAEARKRGAPCLHGDLTAEAAVSDRRPHASVSGRIPIVNDGAPAPPRRPPQFTGDATAEARGGPRIKPARYRPLPGRTYRQSRQALLRRPRASATDRRRAPFVSQTPMPEAGT
jgi:hypothetical protein